MSDSTLFAYVHNKKIDCPHCHEEIEIRRKVGEGATYVHEWKRLPKKLHSIILCWMSKDDMRNSALTKVQLRHKLINYCIDTTEQSSSARISELLGLKVVEYIAGYKTAPHHTAQPPRYKLNLVRAAEIINNAGNLWRVKA